MAGEKEKNDDLYAVLGLKKECTEAELKNAYKKLALRWHPDRCSASGNSKFVEEAKKKFQSIQQAYSVLSDSNKRLLYDVGVYDGDDDDDNGMGDFLSEMVAMMDQTKPNENGEESFEKLQELFQEMFNDDIDGFGPSSPTNYFSSLSSSSYSECSSSSNKRNSSDMNNTNSFQAHVQSFSMGRRKMQRRRRRRGEQEQKLAEETVEEEKAKVENRGICVGDDMSDIQRATVGGGIGIVVQNFQ